MSNENDLVNEYFELVKGTNPYPALQGYSAFMLGSGLTSKRYCEKWYGEENQFHVFILMKEGFSQVWLPEGFMRLASQIGLQEYIKDKEKFQKRLEYFNSKIKKMNDIYFKYTYEEIGRTDISIIIALLKELKDLIWDTNAPLACVNDVDKEMVWDTLEYERFGLSRKEFDDIWEKASEPAFESIDKVQLKEFLNFLLDKRPWEEIVEECQYFLTNYHSAKELSIVEKSLKENYGEFLDKLEKIKEKLKKQSLEVEKISNEHGAWLETLSRNKRTLAEYLYTVMLARDRRKSFLNKGLTITYRIAEKIFKEEGIDKDLIPYYTLEELIRGPEYLKEISEELENRKKGFELLVLYSGEFKMLNIPIEEAVEKMNSYFMGEYGKGQRDNEIRGQIGSKGKVEGKVRVVFDVNSNHGFQENEILVTGMTRPEFVPIMKKAAAIVTDEGGITCHAAIVSRELGIPCVIGTKMATKMFKTGDMVEVDAENGVVRKVK